MKIPTILSIVWFVFALIVLATGIYFKYDYETAFYSALIIANIHSASDYISTRLRELKQ